MTSRAKLISDDETGKSVSETGSASCCSACLDVLEGANRLDFDREMNKYHPDLKALMKQKVVEQLFLEMSLAPDIYNVYFMTLLKKQEDGQYLHVRFPRFYCKSSLGGWPCWTFGLQTLSCIFALRDSLGSQDAILQQMHYTDWMMLLVALFMNQYLFSVQIFDIRLLQLKLKWLAAKKAERSAQMYAWLTVERLRALRFIIRAKALVTFILFVGTAVVVMTKSTSLDFLKSLVVMAFVNTQATIGYKLLQVNDDRRQLGYEGALYTGLADFNLKVNIEERATFEKRPSTLWWIMRILSLTFIMIAILRVPALHDYTVGKMQAWQSQVADSIHSTDFI